MMIKVNGQLTDKVTGIIVPKAGKFGNNIVYSKGVLKGDRGYLKELFDSGSFNIEYDGLTYNVCRIISSKTGEFECLSIK